MEIIYNNHSADAPSSNISQKLVVVSKCPIREGLHEVCVHGAGGGVVPDGVWGGKGCGGGGSTGLVQTVIGAPGLANLLFSSPPAEVGVSMGF